MVRPRKGGQGRGKPKGGLQEVAQLTPTILTKPTFDIPPQTFLYGRDIAEELIKEDTVELLETYASVLPDRIREDVLKVTTLQTSAMGVARGTLLLKELPLTHRVTLSKAKVSIRKDPHVWIPLGLGAIEATGIVQQGMTSANISHGVWSRHSSVNPWFRIGIKRAQLASVATLELVARQRAVLGSDQLLIFLLKNLDRERFGDHVTVKKDSGDFEKRVRTMAEAYGVDPEELLRTAREIAESGGDVIDGTFRTLT